MKDLLSRIISVLGKKLDSPEYQRLVSDLDDVPETPGNRGQLRMFRKSGFTLLDKNGTLSVASLKLDDGACDLPVGVKFGDQRTDVQEKLGFKPLPPKGPPEFDKDHYELNDVVLSLEFDADEKLCGARIWHKPAFRVRNVRPGI